MSTPLQAAAIDPTSLWFSVGFSDESKASSKVFREYKEGRRRLASSAWKDILAGEVSEILESCTVEGWDGNDAEPISPDSAESALEVIKNLPEAVQLPAVVPEPDGDIAFEWGTDGRRFSLSVTGPTLVYAGIFGGSSRQYGEERFFGAIPRTILEILARYFSAA
jgi:hypothetical protein